MTVDDRPRQGHAVLDLPSRAFKARKIARLLGMEPGGPPRRMLEIGTGSGGIAHWFGTDGEMRWDVDSIDVEDTRLVHAGYRFTRVDGVELPFADASFDVVVSNHVIEHVGGPVQQRRHLAEIARVLRPGGRGYLAVPSRWMLVEPHYRLPFLSWVPRPLADAYLRAAGKGGWYDCRPLRPVEAERMLRDAGFDAQQCAAAAMRAMYDLEGDRIRGPARWLRVVPDAFWQATRRALPTLIYVFDQGRAPR